MAAAQRRGAKRVNRQRRQLIDKRLAAREGKRFIAFYRGAQARRASRVGNPYPQATEEARCWEVGWKYAELEQCEGTPSPLCRLGPGGDFVRDWPGGGA